MTTYAEFEASTQDGTPVEIYEITVGTVTLRFTSSSEDVTADGHTWTAIPISRTNEETQPVGGSGARQVSISMPISYLSTFLVDGVPKEAHVRIRRYHAASDGTPATVIVTIVIGDVESINCEDKLVLAVPNAFDVAFAIRLPMAKLSRTCNHDLYDAGCTIDRDYPTYDNYPHMSASSVDSIDGITLVVNVLVDGSAVARPDHWAQFGEVRHVDSGERRSVVEQIGTTITLDRPTTWDVGDDLEVYHGCDHTIEACFGDFNNVDNFGGHPDFGNDLTIGNPHAPNGFGVSSQS